MDATIDRGMNIVGEVGRKAQAEMGIKLENHYRVTARDPQGRLKWEDEFDNLVVTDGLNDSLDKHLKGASYSAAWFLGLTASAPVIAASQVMGNHAGWTEVIAYDEAARQTLKLGSVTAGAVSNSASKAVFTISTNSIGVGGAFVTSGSLKSGSIGILYGVGEFSAGSKMLSASDTLTITTTFTAASA